MKLKWSVLITVFIIHGAQAQVVSTFVREQSGTLPRGRFLLSVLGLTAPIEDQYNSGGIKQSLSSHLNQNIRFDQIATETKDRKSQLRGLFKANQANLSDSAGQLQGSVTGTVKGEVPVIGYGVRDDLGIYVVVPILTFNIQSHAEFVASSSSQNFFKKLEETDQTSLVKEFKSAFHSSLESKLWKSGYVWNPQIDRTYLGDVQVMAIKILPPLPVGQGNKQQIAPFFILPTATARDPQDLYGLQAGDGRWGLGLKYLVEQELPGSFQFDFSISGTFLFASTQARRLPSDSSDELNSDLDPGTNVTGGSKWTSQLQLRYPFPKWVGVNAGLIWQGQLAESWSGSLYAAEAYDQAAKNTGYSLLSSYASIDINSLQSFLSGNFLFPALAEIGVGLPIAGRNAIANPVFELQASLFF